MAFCIARRSKSVLGDDLDNPPRFSPLTPRSLTIFPDALTILLPSTRSHWRVGVGVGRGVAMGRGMGVGEGLAGCVGWGVDVGAGVGIGVGCAVGVGSVVGVGAGCVAGRSLEGGGKWRSVSGDPQPRTIKRLTSEVIAKAISAMTKASLFIAAHQQ